MIKKYEQVSKENAITEGDKISFSEIDKIEQMILHGILKLGYNITDYQHTAVCNALDNIFIKGHFKSSRSYSGYPYNLPKCCGMQMHLIDVDKNNDIMRKTMQCKNCHRVVDIIDFGVREKIKPLDKNSTTRKNLKNNV